MIIWNHFRFLYFKMQFKNFNLIYPNVFALQTNIAEVFVLLSITEKMNYNHVILIFFKIF